MLLLIFKTKTHLQYQIQTRLDVLEPNWQKFEKDLERILESKKENPTDGQYITEDHYRIAEESYILSKSALLELL